MTEPERLQRLLTFLHALKNHYVSTREEHATGAE